MRFSRAFFLILTILTSVASLSLAQNPHVCSSPNTGWNSQGCSIYGGCAAVQNTGGNTCNQHCHSGLFGYWYRDRAYFEYEPILTCPGDRVSTILEQQKLNGRIAQMVFHNFHFEWNAHQQSWMLSRSGWIHVQELARILPGTPGPLQIAPSGNPVNDQIRVQIVHEAFAKTGVSNLPQIVIQAPEFRGLFGDEALKLYEQRQMGSPQLLGAESTDGSGAQAGSSGTSGGR